MSGERVPAPHQVPGPSVSGDAFAVRVKVSPFVAFFWRDGQLVCDDPWRHRQLALTPQAERLLRVFADWQPMSAAKIAGDGAERLAARLVSAGVLIAEDSAEHHRESELGAWRDLGTVATHFHHATRTHDRDDFADRREDNAALRARAGRQPSPYLDRSGARLTLPPPGRPEGELADVLTARRSTRDFDRARSVGAEQLSTLLDWAFGARYVVDVPDLGPTLLKTSPSGGARHPVEVYPVLRRVDGLRPGVYHYSVRRHDLELLGPPPDDTTVEHWCGGQRQAVDAAVLLLYTARLDRTVWKYPHARAYRAPFLDLGHLGQTVYLLATALDLGVFFTAATRDEPVERALELSWTEEILLGVTGLGIPTEAERARQTAMRNGGPAGFSFPAGDRNGSQPRFSE
ncbi:MAG TPA: SagB family peptide dehydrogenase [Actinopolymorphaceae bacterium]